MKRAWDKKVFRKICTGFTCLLFFTAAVFFTISDVSANGDEIMDEIRALKKRIDQLEKKLAEQETKIQQQEKKIVSTDDTLSEIADIKETLSRFDFYVGATSVVQGTVNNDRNLRKVPGMGGKGDDTDASYSVDIEITSKIGEHGMALLYLETGEGEGLNSEAGGLTGVNFEALGDDADVQVSEVWYEHSFFDDKLVATVGKMDITRWFDTNEVADDESSQFLADIFVDNLALNLPDNFYAYGARLGYFPSDMFEINLGYVESNGDFEDLFDDNLMIGEVAFKPKFGDLQGNYRFYAWRNTGEHQKLRVPLRTDKTGEGVGISFDQQLSKNITAFCRYGQQHDDIYPVRRTWSLGFQVAGSVWGRDNDMFGLAYGAAETSGAYRDVIRDAGFGTTPAESRIEAYYRYQINDHLAISPDVQWVDGLMGASNADAITILGVRAQLDF